MEKKGDLNDTGNDLMSGHPIQVRRDAGQVNGDSTAEIDFQVKKGDLDDTGNGDVCGSPMQVRRDADHVDGDRTAETGFQVKKGDLDDMENGEVCGHPIQVRRDADQVDGDSTAETGKPGNVKAQIGIFEQNGSATNYSKQPQKQCIPERGHMKLRRLNGTNKRHQRVQVKEDEIHIETQTYNGKHVGDRDQRGKVKEDEIHTKTQNYNGKHVEDIKKDLMAKVVGNEKNSENVMCDNVGNDADEKHEIQCDHLEEPNNIADTDCKGRLEKLKSQFEVLTLAKGNKQENIFDDDKIGTSGCYTSMLNYTIPTISKISCKDNDNPRQHLYDMQKDDNICVCKEKNSSKSMDVRDQCNGVGNKTLRIERVIPWQHMAVITSSDMENNGGSTLQEQCIPEITRSNVKKNGDMILQEQCIPEITRSDVRNIGDMILQEQCIPEITSSDAKNNGDMILQEQCIPGITNSDMKNNGDTMLQEQCISDITNSDVKKNGDMTLQKQCTPEVTSSDVRNNGDMTLQEQCTPEVTSGDVKNNGEMTLQEQCTPEVTSSDVKNNGEMTLQEQCTPEVTSSDVKTDDTDNQNNTSDIQKNSPKYQKTSDIGESGLSEYRQNDQPVETIHNVTIIKHESKDTDNPYLSGSGYPERLIIASVKVMCNLEDDNEVGLSSVETHRDEAIIKDELNLSVMSNVHVVALENTNPLNTTAIKDDHQLKKETISCTNVIKDETITNRRNDICTTESMPKMGEVVNYSSELGTQCNLDRNEIDIMPHFDHRNERDMMLNDVKSNENERNHNTELTKDETKQNSATEVHKEILDKSDIHDNLEREINEMVKDNEAIDIDLEEDVILRQFDAEIESLHSKLSTVGDWEMDQELGLQTVCSNSQQSLYDQVTLDYVKNLGSEEELSTNVAVSTSNIIGAGMKHDDKQSIMAMNGNDTLNQQTDIAVITVPTIESGLCEETIIVDEVKDRAVGVSVLAEDLTVSEEKSMAKMTDCADTRIHMNDDKDDDDNDDVCVSSSVSGDDVSQLDIDISSECDSANEVHLKFDDQMFESLDFDSSPSDGEFENELGGLEKSEDCKTGKESKQQSMVRQKYVYLCVCPNNTSLPLNLL